MASTDLTVRDNIDHALEGLSPVRGTPLKFDNGTWFRGFEKDNLNLNQDFLFADTSEAWQFLKKGAPVEYVPREPGSPGRPPRPSSFTAEEAWPLYNGEPSDPWRYCCIVHLLALANGETFHLCSPTAGAWTARSELLEQVKSMRMMRPGSLPIVRLGSTSFKTQFGTRKRPMFRIVGWQRPTTEDAESKLIAATAEPAEPVKVEPTKTHKSKAKTAVAEIVSEGTERVHPFNDELPY
jgi:hypothetical protein